MNWSGKKQGAVSWPQSQVVHTLEYGQLSQPVTAYLREIIDININWHTQKKILKFGKVSVNLYYWALLLHSEIVQNKGINFSVIILFCNKEAMW